jgi:hypothetical protein
MTNEFFHFRKPKIPEQFKRNSIALIPFVFTFNLFSFYFNQVRNTFAQEVQF